MTQPMSMPLLPDWARIVWAAAMVWVVVMHLRHAAGVAGRRRYWHAGHIAMSAGMAAMYLLPRMTHGELYRGGLALYAALAACVIGAAVGLGIHDRAPDPLWVVSALDFTAMTYMLISPEARPAWLTYLAVAWLGAEALAWLARAFDRLPAVRRAAEPGPGVVAGPGAAVDPREMRTSPAVAISLAVMAAGMSYMLAAM